jgi:hypothetical protein
LFGELAAAVRLTRPGSLHLQGHLAAAARHAGSRNPAGRICGEGAATASSALRMRLAWPPFKGGRRMGRPGT